MNSINYLKYSSIDFSLDDYFIQWIKNPDEHNDLFWTSFIEEYADKREAIEEARAVVLQMVFQEVSVPETRVKALKQEIFTTIRENQSTESEERFTISSYKKTSWFAANWYKVAAVFLGFSAIGAVVFLLSLQLFYTKSYSTNFGETQKINFPDGSFATLNANSDLKFSNDWNNEKPREVWVDGEAFFSVTHKTNNQKFIVHIGRLNVEVLGTQFNVNYKKGKVEVVLNSGKVKLSKSNQTNDTGLTMKPGEMVEFSEKEKVYVKKTVNPEIYSSWTSRKWIINDKPLSLIIEKIEHDYGYTVELEDPTQASLQITGTFPVHNIDILIKSLSTTLNTDIIKSDNKLIIRK